MAAVTLESVKRSARVEGNLHDAELQACIDSAQSLIEMACRLSDGALNDTTKESVKRAITALAVFLFENPTASADDISKFQRSGLIDGAISWL